MRAPTPLPGRCSRARCAASACDACATSCPRAAVSLEPLPHIDTDRCSGCEACVAACPLGALHGQRHGIETLSARLGGVGRPVIGCQEQSGSQGHARVPCLAALDLSDLVGLAAALPRCIRLDGTHCVGCANQPAMAALEERLRVLERGGLDGRFQLVHAREDLRFEPRRLARRGFLRALLQEGADAAPAGGARPERQGPAGGKHVPAGTRVLAGALERLPAPAARALRPATRFRAVATSDCDACGRCAAVCPTGALSRRRGDSMRTLDFAEALCVGCDACVDFCPTHSLRIGPAAYDKPPPRVRITARRLHQETYVTTGQPNHKVDNRTR